MLSKKISKEAFALLLAHVDGLAEKAEDFDSKLSGTRELWVASQSNLLEGNYKLNLEEEHDKDILQRYEDMNPAYQRMLDIVFSIRRQATAGTSFLNDAALSEKMAELAYTSDPFLKQQNAIVNEYQRISEERLNVLVIVEAVFLGISCIVVIIEAILIVPKVIKSLQKTFAEAKEIDTSTKSGKKARNLESPVSSTSSLSFLSALLQSQDKV